MAGRKAIVKTEIQRVFYADGSDRTIKWLAARLGLKRQVVGRWLAGEEAIPRRRQAQLLVHLELEGQPLTRFFEENGYARRLDS